MKKLESTLLNMALVLTSVSLVAGALLGYMNQLTAEPIRIVEANTLSSGIKKVILGGAEGELTLTKVDTVLNDKGKVDFVIYSTADASGKPLGTAVQRSENGFGGPLTVLTGFDDKGTILGYEVLKHSETPGLGAKAGEWFRNKGNIIGRTPSTPLKVSKDNGDVDAITASTITSRAFLKAVNASYNHLFVERNANSGATTTKE